MKINSIKEYVKNIDLGNKNILLITHDLTATGAPIVLFSMAKLLKKNGFKVAMYSRKDGELANDILNENIDLIIETEINSYKQVSVDDYKNFDLVIVNTLVNIHHINAFMNTDINVLWWVHEAQNIYDLTYYDLFPESLDKELNTKLFIDLLPERLSSNIKVYCVGDYPKKLLLKHRPEYKISILLYSIEDRYIKQKIKNSNKKVKFCIVGTVYERKGQIILAEAIQYLSEKEMADCEFYFIGKAVDQEYYNVLNMYLKNYTNVHIIESMPQEELYKYYRDMDCLVCASTDDPMPVVVGESMMFNKVVICSENSGSHVLIKDGYNGFVYRNNDAKQLFYKLRYFIKYKNSLDNIANRSRLTYMKCFSEDSLLKSIKGILYGDLYIKQSEYLDECMKDDSKKGIALYEGEELIYKSNNKNIRIAVDQLSATGQPKVALITAKILIEMGYNVYIHSTMDGEIKEEFLKLGITVLVDNNLLVWNGYSEEIINNNINQTLVNYIKNIDYNIVFGIASYSHIILCKLSNIKAIWYIHDGSMGIKNFYNNLPKEVGELINVYVGGSYVDRILNETDLSYKQKILDYGFEIKNTNNNIRDRKDDKVVFLMPGIIHERKGQDILIEAISILNKEYLSKCRFIFIGENYNDKINDKIEKLCIDNKNCEKIDSLPFEEFLNLYDDVDVVLCPSRDDPAPFVLTEALAKKKIIVSSTNTGLADYITDGLNGFVFNNEDYIELSKKIRFIIDNIESLKLVSENGFQIYENNFTLDKYKENIKKTLRIYDTKR